MKVVHINKKNLEYEAAILRMGQEIAEKRNMLEMKRFLKLRAKKQAQEEFDNKHGITRPSMDEIIQLEARGRALLELAKEMRKRL